MRQPIKGQKAEIKSSKPKKQKKEFKKSIEASDLDGSGLETFFRKNVLDKIGVNYIQQYSPNSTGRIYDFFLPEHRILIECDGDYFHGNPNIYKNKLSPMQRKNKRVDESKNEWALLNGYVIIRFWESEIKGNTSKIIKMLKTKLNLNNGK